MRHNRDRSRVICLQRKCHLFFFFLIGVIEFSISSSSGDSLK